MDVFKEGKYFRYVEKAPVWLTISAIVILIGIAFMVYNKATMGSFFNMSIHYTGGQKVILQMAEEVEPDGQNVKQIVEKYSAGEPIVQVDQQDPHVITIRMRVAGEDASDREITESLGSTLRSMKEELGNAYGGFVSVDEVEADGTLTANPITQEEASVGPTVGAELVAKAIMALVIGCLLIMIYILIRFGRWQMSLAAIGALVHDVLVTLGVTAIFRLEVADSFIAVILTIIGYSINDTIIIFDRIRENVRSYGDSVPLAQVSNLSLNQTLVRSLNTVITVIFMIIALIFFGGSNLRPFLLAMLAGMISGGYSSIFVATPLMLWLTGGKLKLSPEEEDKGIALKVTSPDFSVPEAEVETEAPGSDQPAGESKGIKKAGKKQRRR